MRKQRVSSNEQRASAKTFDLVPETQEHKARSSKPLARTPHLNFRHKKSRIKCGFGGLVSLHFGRVSKT